MAEWRGPESSDFSTIAPGGEANRRSVAWNTARIQTKDEKAGTADVGSVLPAWCRVPTKPGAFLAMAAMLLSVSGGSAGQTASPNGAIPTLVNYNGILIDESGNALSGPQGVTFLLYEEQEGGSPLWMETQTVVGDKSGRYSAVLGSSTSQGLPTYLFASSQARWLGVQTQGQAEQPRIMLLAVPYALKA